jgi:hypothetical protein
VSMSTRADVTIDPWFGRRWIVGASRFVSMCMVSVLGCPSAREAPRVSL